MCVYLSVIPQMWTSAIFAILFTELRFITYYF